MTTRSPEPDLLGRRPLSMSRRTVWSGVLAVSLALFAGCAPDRPPERPGQMAGPDRAQAESSADPGLPFGITAELIEEGRGIYSKQGFCYVCHGYDGSGGAGADFTDDEWWHSDGTLEGIIGTIVTGVTAEQSRGGQAAVMDPRGGTQITDEQVRALAAYVWSLHLEGSVSTP